MASTKREKKSRVEKRLPKQARPGASDGIFIPATRTAVVATEQPGPVNALSTVQRKRRRSLWQRLRRIFQRR